MAKQTINIGASPNDGTGTPLRTAFDYTNQNFTELYTATGPSGNNIVVPGSATITGDLTVKTNVLKVDTTNNRVGVGTATPATILDIQSAGGVFARIQNTASSADAYLLVKNTVGEGFFGINATGPYIYTAGSLPITFTTATSERYRIASDGVATWSNVGGVAGTAMTLNATGLGVGTSPTVKLDALTTVVGNSNALTIGNNEYGAATYLSSNSVSLTFNRGQTFKTAAIVSSNITNGNLSEGYIKFQTSASNVLTDRMLIDNLGNVGIGVVPSAWAASFKAIDIGSGCLVSQPANQTAGIFSNSFANGTNYTRKALGTAGGYDIYNGAHYWLTAASGAAGSTFAFGDAKMTLDASGNLLVGRTAALGGKIGAQVEGGNGAAYLLRHNGATAGKYRIFAIDGSNNGLFYDQNNVGMYMADAGTAWIATSDETQKDIIEPISNAISKVGSLRAVIGKFKTDANSVRRSFLIAQDVQTALPEAVHQKDGLLGLSYTDVIPLLVAAIKELTAEVNALKNA